MVTVSPPCGLPVFGWTEARKKVAGIPASPIWTEVSPTPVETWARRLAVPTVGPGKKETVACPLTSSSVTSAGPPTLPKLPSEVVSAATVRFGTGIPVSERTARMVIVAGSVAFTSRDAALELTVTLTVEAGGKEGVEGAVGDFASSALQPSASAKPMAKRGLRKRFEALMIVLSSRLKAARPR